MIVAVTAAAGRLEIVGLGGLNAAQSRTAALNIHDQTGQVTAGHIGNTFTLQGDSGTGGGGHGPLACGSCANDHVDRGDLALRLQEGAADLRHTLRHISGDLGLGGDGIAEIVPAAGHDGGFSQGFVALHQDLFSHVLTSLFNSNDTVGAHRGAERAGDALGLVGHLRRVVALLVDLIPAELQDLLGAGSNAEAAALAQVLLECNLRHSRTPSPNGFLKR